MNKEMTLRWVSLPFTVFGVFGFVGVTTSLVLDQRGVWMEPIVGAVCAAVVVLSTALFAPKSRVLSSFVALLVGAAVASYFLHNSSYPEVHPKAYQRTFIPLYGTLASGLLSFGFVLVTKLVKDKSSRCRAEANRQLAQSNA